MGKAELILKIAYWSAITLAAILKTRSARRFARCLFPAFLCAHIFIKRETSGYEADIDAFPKKVFLAQNVSLSEKKNNWRSRFVKIFPVSSDEVMGK